MSKQANKKGIKFLLSKSDRFFSIETLINSERNKYDQSGSKRSQGGANSNTAAMTEVKDLKSSGRVTLYIKDLSEEEMDFYFNNKKRASTLIKIAMHNYFESERGTADGIDQSKDHEEKKPTQRKNKNLKNTPPKQKELDELRPPITETKESIPEQPISKADQDISRQPREDISKTGEKSSPPSITEDEQEKIKAMLLKNFKIF